MKKLHSRFISVASAIAIIGIEYNARSGCYVTTTPECSAYFENEYPNCEDSEVESSVFSGGGTMSKCTGSDDVGSLGCQDLGLAQCSYTWTVKFCDGTTESQNLSGPVNKTQDNGIGPCPPPSA